MNKKIIAAISATVLMQVSIASAMDLPHRDLVQKYLQMPSLHSGKMSSCKGSYMMLGNDAECWAAHTAKALIVEPKDTQTFIWDTAAREAAMGKCKAMSGKERFESRICLASIQAQSFISLRLPRTTLNLEPLKFK
jgi:hypothetical protein